MNPEHWGVPAPSPTTESKFFNAARPTVTLVVEAGSDQRFWQMHAHAHCHIRHVGQGGRPAALSVLNESRDHPDAVLLAVLDADLDRVEARLQVRADVVWTDAHDLETTLLGLPVLEKVVSQTVAPRRLQEIEARWRESLRSRLFRHAEGMGRLRWLKSRRGDLLALSFKKAVKRAKQGYQAFSDYAACADAEWAPSIEHVVRAVVNYSNAQSLLRIDLVAAVNGLPEAAADQICNGHDLVGFLWAWLRSLGGAGVPESPQTLATQLLGAVERDWLERTGMWSAIEAWECLHPGYRVLADRA